MRMRIRNFFSNGPLGITVPIGVILGYALIGFANDLYYAFVLPVLRDLGTGDKNPHQLTLDVGDVTLRWGYALDYSFILLFLAAVIYFVFIWRSGVSKEPAIKMRACPECKGDIVSDATRCAHCTAQVTPMTAD